MKRRIFLGVIAGGFLAAPLAAEAQSAGKTARVGWLALGPNAGPAAVFFDAFREGLRERGWIDGRNLVIEARWGDRDQARDQAAELVQWKPDVLVTQGPMVFGAQAVTGPIPVVFGFSGDPVEGKLVASLARPGGSLTGISLMQFELIGKRLEVLKEAVPGVTRVALLANTGHPGVREELARSQAAARRLGFTVQYVPVAAVRDFDGAFEAMARERAEAIVVFPDGFMMSQAPAIADFAARRRIAAISGWAEFAAAGNLLSYGPDLREAWRGVAAYVDKILRGARPADLPVEQPTKFELVINLKTAKALGLTIPPSLLQRVDQVIE
jgi:putative tryptophan/tyrosine transport system substrate-binding protein